MQRGETILVNANGWARHARVVRVVRGGTKAVCAWALTGGRLTSGTRQPIVAEAMGGYGAGPRGCSPLGPPSLDLADAIVERDRVARELHRAHRERLREGRLVCIDCGEIGESVGHMGCQYPGRVSA